MSGHRRVKNVGYDDDDFEDEYDEEDEGGFGAAETQGGDEMTEDDREQLREGTVKVRAALGSSSSTSDFAIQEALWHYWFDVDKTVVYLKNKELPQQTHKQAKATSRFDQAAAASAAKAEETLASASTSKLPFDLTRLGMGRGRTLHSTADWREDPALRSTDTNPGSYPFSNVPWTGLPEAMTSKLSPTMVREQPRMLGGSGKVSKLAALAAARKARESKAADTGNSSDGKSATSNAISLLDRLKPGSTAEFSAQPVAPAVSDFAQPQQSTMSRISLRPKASAPLPTPPQQEAQVEPAAIPEEAPAVEPAALLGLDQLQGPPSAFAQDFCSRPDHSITPYDQTHFSSNISNSLVSGTNSFSPSGFSGPSPDAIVLQAQTKGKTSTPKKKDGGPAKVASAIDDLSLEDPALMIRDRSRIATKVQSKNLNVIEEYTKAHGKKESNFVVVGHIDHGKSTLMGRLLYEHKVIDQRSLDKFRREAAKIGKESFALAWVMDAREDEREHGVTIDYAEKTFETEKAIFTIIDAPGHRDFVGNMIAGTSMADFALMVIDAGTNSFEAGLKGQTREHAQVVRCMKLEKLIIAANKMDSVSWSQEAFNSVRQKTTSFLAELLFNPSDLVFVPCSGLTGDNIITPPSTQAPWYTGPTLVQALEAIDPNRAQYLGALTDPFRLRIASLAGLSEYSEFLSNAHEPFTALGRIDAGTVQVGDALLAEPGGETCVVRGITHRGGTPADWAVAGQIVGLQLTDCDEERFAKGDVLCAAQRPAAKPVRTALMKILAFDGVFPMPVDVHRGRLRATARIVDVLATLDPRSHAVLKDRPKLVRHGETARVRIEFDEPVALERRSRVVLRYGGETVAAGAVERALE